MSIWQIKAYYLRGGTCPIQDWYRVQDVSVQAEFDATLAVLKATVNWRKTRAFGALKRAHVGLGEIRFKLEKPELRRFRPVESGLQLRSVNLFYCLAAKRNAMAS